MKVLFLSTSDSGGGAALAAYRLHKELLKKQLNCQMLVAEKFTQDSSVLTLHPWLIKILRPLVCRLDTLLMKIFQTPTNNTYGSVGWQGLPVIRKVKKINPDIIQLNWVCGGFLSISSIAKLGALGNPVVWRLSDMWPFSSIEHYVGNSTLFKEGYFNFDLSGMVWRQKLKAWKKIQNLTIVAPSQWLAQCAKESVLFKDRPIHVIPTGVNINKFIPSSNKMDLRKELGLPQNKKLLLFGAIRPTSDARKGYFVLEKTLSILKEKLFFSNSELVIFGDEGDKGFQNMGFSSIVSDLRPTLSPTHRALSLAPPARIPAVHAPANPPVHHFGKIDSEDLLIKIYTSCDAFVAPSLEENLANTVLEAMACGLPTVAFHIGGMPDMIEHKKNGYLARPFEPEDLANGIQFVLENQTLSFEAREKIETQFSMDSQAKQYIALYEKLLLRS